MDKKKKKKDEGMKREQQPFPSLPALPSFYMFNPEFLLIVRRQAFGIACNVCELLRRERKRERREKSRLIYIIQWHAAAAASCPKM